MEKEIEFKKRVEEQVRQLLPKYLKTTAFTVDKITDTPTESLSVVSRRYVTMNGSIAGRPTSSVATVGQFYLATDLATPTPLWYTSGGWRNGVGSIVAGT